EDGLRPHVPVVNQITSIPVSFPFPQMFIGHVHSILMTGDKLYTINADWSVTLQLDLSGVIVNQTTWHFADYHDYVILCNEEVTIVYDTTTTVYTNRAADSTMPLLRSVMDFNGQIIAVPNSTWHDTDTNSLIWSAIGSADFSVTQSNVRGYRPMPWDGEVYKVMKLGDHPMAYGSGGVAACKFSGVNLGLLRTFDFGIWSREAVGGDEFGQVLISEKGELIELTPDLSIKTRGYTEFFENMGEISVTFDPEERDFYISDGVTSFIKTDQGLARINQAATSLDYYAGQLIGPFTDLNDDEGRIVSDTIDFGRRGRKTVDVIEVGADSISEVYVAADWRMDKTASFRRTPFKRLNIHGETVLPIAGNEFRFVIKSDNYLGFNLDYYIARIKLDDKRFIRGTNANTSTS
ncbi:MAG: hypothetical protein KAS32_12655, partial [Candidatus Peribacteraceae bacterium]|nr:hypothetical protein [Candidatus Peribacteraceae bacterium]